MKMHAKNNHSLNSLHSSQLTGKNMASGYIFFFTCLLCPRKSIDSEAQQLWVQILAQWFKICTRRNKFPMSLSPSFPLRREEQTLSLSLSLSQSLWMMTWDDMRWCERRALLSRDPSRGVGFPQRLLPSTLSTSSYPILPLLPTYLVTKPFCFLPL